MGFRNWSIRMYVCVFECIWNFLTLISSKQKKEQTLYVVPSRYADEFSKFFKREIGNRNRSIENRKWNGKWMPQKKGTNDFSQICYVNFIFGDLEYLDYFQQQNRKKPSIRQITFWSWKWVSQNKNASTIFFKFNA